MKKLSIIAVMIASLTPAIAQANPTWTYRLSATALGGSNILLTNTYGGGKPSNDIAVFYGTSHSDWVDRPDTSADTGSGSRTLQVREICDCHVPAKTLLRYQLSPEWAYAWGGGACEVTSTDFGGLEPCKSACAAADARDAAAPADAPSAGDVRGDGADRSGVADAGGDATVDAVDSAYDAAAEADAPSAGGAGGGGGSTGGSGAGGTTTAAPGGSGSGVTGGGGVGGSTTAVSGGATGSGGATAPVESGGVSGNRSSTSALTSTAAKKGGGPSCSLALAARPAVLSAVWVLGALALAFARRRRS